MVGGFRGGGGGCATTGGRPKYGFAVAVGGKLVDKQYLPEAFRDAKGMISQGAAGTQSVIESPTWRLIQEPPK